DAGDGSRFVVESEHALERRRFVRRRPECGVERRVCKCANVSPGSWKPKHERIGTSGLLGSRMIGGRGGSAGALVPTARRQHERNREKRSTHACKLRQRENLGKGSAPKRACLERRVDRELPDAPVTRRFRRDRVAP